MGPMVRDAKPAFDDRSHATTGPDGAQKTERFRALGQEVTQFGELLRRQAGFGAGWWLVAQAIAATVTATFQPLAHRTATDAKGIRNRRLFPALLGEFPRPQAAAFAPITWF